MQLKHFVAYHSVEAMGYAYPDEDLRFFTAKHALAQHAIGQIVWVIEGVRQGRHTSYGLCGVFLVTRVEQHEEQSIVKGPLIELWDKRLELNALKWFPELLRRNANFSLGFNEITDPQAIEGLMACASTSLPAWLAQAPAMVRIENFTIEDYSRALEAVAPSEIERDLLQIHCVSPGGDQTARQLAMAMGFRDWRQTNLVYGKLAARLCKALGVEPDTKLSVLVRFHHDGRDECRLVLRCSAALAIRAFTYADVQAAVGQEEMALEEPLYEGAVQVVQVNAFERNPKARAACVAHYGLACTVCGFRFEATYGNAAKKYIQVHHLTALATIGEEHQIDPVKDLRPVCANCHCVIHLRTPPYAIEEVQQLLQAQSMATVS